MAEPASSDGDLESGRVWTPAPASAALLPGVLMLFVGLWMVTDGGPLILGWASFAIGMGLLLVGAVAWGVSWGMDLYDHRRP